MKNVLTRVVFVGVLGLAVNSFAAKGGGPVIENGRTVTFDYTLTVDGKVVDSSVGHKPLQYKHGEGKIIPGLSKQLEGLRQGDEKDVTVAPEEAYGQRNSKAFQEVPKSRMPQNIDLKTGTQLQATSQDGRALLVTVSEVKKDSVILDFNHPLAGKELRFHVKVVGVQ